MKEILISIINDLEKTAIQLETVKAAVKGADPKTAAELAGGLNSGFYNDLRERVDALP